MIHLVPVYATITALKNAKLFRDTLILHHGLPTNILSDRESRLASAFWTSLFELFGTKLYMSTTAHPETYRQTGRV